MSLRLLGLTSVLALCAGQSMAEMNFNRIASFPVLKNMADGADQSRACEGAVEIRFATRPQTP